MRKFIIPIMTVMVLATWAIGAWGIVSGQGSPTTTIAVTAPFEKAYTGNDPLVPADAGVGVLCPGCTMLTAGTLADLAGSADAILTALDTRAGVIEADNWVTERRIADDAVTGRKIPAGAIGRGLIANAAIDNQHLANGAVTSAKIADNTIIGGNIRGGSIDASRLTDSYLQLSGGTLTGALTLSGAPTSDLHAATKKYVDDNGGGDLSGLRSQIDQNTERTSDIKTVTPPAWNLAANNQAQVVQSTTDSSDAAVVGALTGWSNTITSLGSSQPLYARVAAGQDPADYRFQETSIPSSVSWRMDFGAVWLSIGADDTWMYYKLTEAGRDNLDSAETYVMQHHGADHHTSFGGEFHGRAQELLDAAGATPQVVQAASAGPVTIAANAGETSVLTGSITPASASNRIRIDANASVSMTAPNSQGTYDLRKTLRVRCTTDVSTGLSSRTEVLSAMAGNDHIPRNDTVANSMWGVAVYSPTTTDEVTCAITIQTTAAARTASAQGLTLILTEVF